MRTMMMITILVLMATMVKSDENVVVNFLKSEKEKTIAYQTKVWADQKVKNAEMWSKLKTLFKGNNDTQD
jgi:hypothetical protein|tara:strand:+ start:726 stop:935 length:210 start_codon:yes stop_codon:yes gene_type:complete